MSETAQGDGAALFPFDSFEWIQQNPHLRGKRPVQGDGGFYLQHVVMEPGYEVTPHHHSMDELIVVLEGGCEFGPDRIPLAPHDSAVLKAGHDYGFVVGPHGMRFLIVRNGPATNSRNVETTSPVTTNNTRGNG
jgi:hypothetical protein